MARRPSFGEYRVGIDFNPSKNPTVDTIKTLAAGLIDAIDNIQVVSEPADEATRLKRHAMTLIEDGAMNAVKAATKKNWE